MRLLMLSCCQQNADNVLSYGYVKDYETDEVLDMFSLPILGSLMRRPNIWQENFLFATLVFAHFAFATLKFDICFLLHLSLVRSNSGSKTTTQWAKAKCQYLEWPKQSGQNSMWQKTKFTQIWHALLRFAARSG
jgi:hypothetical protein